MGLGTCELANHTNQTVHRLIIHIVIAIQSLLGSKCLLNVFILFFFHAYERQYMRMPEDGHNSHYVILISYGHLLHQ